MGNWKRLRIAIQAGILLLFLYLFLRTGMQKTPAAALFFWFDPLVALANTIADRALRPWWFWSIFTIVLTLIAGRVWCGWVCPLGTLLDVVPGRLPDARQVDRLTRWRKLKFGVLLLILFCAILGNLTLIFLDPITLLYRSLAGAFWPAALWLFNSLEALMYHIAPLRGIVEQLDRMLRATVVPASVPIMPFAVFTGLLVIAVLALNLVRKRFWCRYVCPLGALLGLLSRFAFLQRRVETSCRQCRACARHCPTGTIDPQRANESDPAECIMCLDCLEPCPADAQTFRFRLPVRKRWDYDPSLRTAFGSLGVALLGTGLMGIEPVLNRRTLPLRPPGVKDEAEFLARCIRCGVCIEVCPTKALQPSITHSGWVGFLTPVLVPRIGYCDYSCNKCGQVCPAGAIPQLSLEEKRQAVIGYAYVDRSRCIPWVDFRNCIVCEEMCPVPVKAIQTEEVEVWAPDGQRVKVKRPHVIHERCIGCGICENHCPVSGEAAIRVKPATDLSVLF